MYKLLAAVIINIKTNNMKHAIDWFGIPSKDFERAVNFYQSILSSELKANEVGGMKVAILPHNREEHGVGGAIYHGPGNEPAGHGTIVYLHADSDLATVLTKVEQYGGKIVMAKTPIGENGFIAQFLDSEGNRVGLHSEN
jgi:predicted enzyme related to lactoylglutathione lyase